MKIKMYTGKLTAFLLFLVMLTANTGILNYKINADDEILTMQSISVPRSVTSGDIFTASITVKNDTKEDRSNVSVSVIFSNSAIINQSFDRLELGTVKAGESASVEFTFQANSSTAAMCQIRFSLNRGGSEVEYRNINVNVSAAPVYDTSPDFTILAKTSPHSAIQGSTYSVAMRFANVGGVSSSTTASITAPDKGFKAKTLTNINYGTFRNGQVEELTFSFDVTAEAEIGENIFIFEIKSGSTVIYTNYISVVIEENEELQKAEKSSISISGIDIAEQVDRRTDTKISVTIKNGNKKSEDIKLEIIPPAGGGVVNKSPNIVTINYMEADEEREVEFDFYISKDASDNYNLFKIIVTENSLSENPVSFSQYTGFNVTPEEDEEKESPVFDIKVDIKENVMAGEGFNFKVTVKNTGGDATNISLDAVLSEAVMNTTAKTFKINELKKGESITKEISCIVPETTKSGYNAIKVVLAHGSDLSEQYSGIYVHGIEDEEKESPIFDIKVDIKENVTAGESFNFKITIKNMGGDAENYTLEAFLPDVILNTTAKTFKINELKKGESITKEISCTVLETAATLYNTIKVSFSTSADINEQYAGIYVTAAESDKTKPVIIIQNVEVPSIKGIESDFQVKVTLKNDGTDAKNIKLTLTGSSAFINKSNNVIQIDELKAGASVTKTFMLMALKTAANGFNTITVDAEYSGNNGSTPTSEKITYYSGLNISNPEKEKEDELQDDEADTPVIIISKFNYGGEAVYGGKVFTFELELLNTHKEKEIKDLKVTVSQEKGIFNPRQGSNTFFVERLNAGETTKQTIDLIVKADTIPDSYGLTVTMTYKGGAKTDIVATEIINIPVTQETKFNIGEIPIIQDITMREEASVYIQFGNLGKSIIYNAVVKVQGEGFYNQEGEYYAGNIEAGKHLSKEFYLVPTEPGAKNGKLVFTYEDSNGEVTTEERDFFFNVMSDENSSMGGLEVRPGGIAGNEIAVGEIMLDEYGNPVFDENGNPVMVQDPSLMNEEAKFWSFKNMTPLKWGLFGAIGGGFIIMTVAIVVAVKKKKSKIDDDDDDEYDIDTDAPANENHQKGHDSEI